MKALLPLALLVGAAPGTAQQIWKVHCTGAYGAQFTDLPQAVAAAAPGDEIWLYSANPPCANEYSATLITKPLRIVGFTVGSVTAINPFGVRVRGTFAISGIQAGVRVTLSNIGISAPVFPATSGVVATDCAGDVLLEDVYYVGSNIMGTSFIRFERCNNVVLRGCGLQLGPSPVTAIDSNVLISFTNAGVQAPSWWFGAPPMETAPALRVINSTVTLVSSAFKGGNEVNPSTLPARPAAVVEGGTLRLGPASNLIGGDLSWWPWAQVGYEIVTPGVVERDPRTAISSYTFIPTAQLPVDRHFTSVDHNWATAGLPVSVWVGGHANGFALLAISDWSPFPQATPWGTLVLDPLTFLIFDFLVCAPPDGWVNRVYQIPATAPVGHAWVLQALSISPLGEFSLTIPSPFTVAWPNGGIP